MNLILISMNEVDSNGFITLQDRRSEHIINILQANVGDILKVGIINGAFGKAEVSELIQGQPGKVVLQKFSAVKSVKIPLIDLILAMPRPIMLKRILGQAVTLGVGRIFLINANRVEKSFFNASLLKKEKYMPVILQGLEQAMDTRVPEITIHKRFRPFVEDTVPEISDEYSMSIVAHPEASCHLTDIMKNAGDGRILLALGPEGGWVDFEIDKFKEQGFHICNIGSRILRVDTSVTALLAQVEILRRFQEKKLTC